MYKILTSICLIVGLSLTTTAQDCNFFPMIEGATFEITTYSASGKAEAVTSTKVTEVKNISGGVSAVVSSEITGGEVKEKVGLSYEVKCVNGELQINMGDMFNTESMQDMMGGQGMDVDMKVESDNLIFPSRMDIGKTLPDATMKMQMKAMGMEMDITTIISERKVEKKETLTTPAGTFDCYKMTYLTSTDGMMGMKMNFRSTAWYNEKVGMVRTEDYDQAGKINSYTELTAFKE